MRVLGIGFAIFWMIFTFLEYWQYHEETRQALSFFQYTEFVLVFLPFGGLSIFLFHRFRDKKAGRFLSTGPGLITYCSLLALMSINVFFYENIGNLLTFQENLNFLFSIVGVALALYFLVLIFYSSGRMIYRLFARSDQENAHLIYIGIGIMVIVALLFLLGIFGALFGFVLWPLLLFLLYLSWRSAWQFIRISVLTPIPVASKISPLGLGILYLLLIFLTMNFVQVVRPFPTGFDAMTHYVNISVLVKDYHGLVAGHGTYNWSLLMSLGLLLFGKMSVTLALSYLGGLFSLFALFQLSRKWLHADYSLLVLLLFYTIPMVSWLSYRDMKVDMGLLFYSLLIVLLFVYWLSAESNPPPAPIKKVKKKKKQKSNPAEYKSEPGQRFHHLLPGFITRHPDLSLIGVFMGFALGIKFSALIILLALVPAIAYAIGGRIMFAAATAIVLGFVLLGKLDDQAALRPLHLWADQLQWLLVLLGLGLSVYLFVKQKDSLLKVLRLSIVCIVLSGIFISPWLIKNVVETRSLSLSGLVDGRSAHPKPTIQEIKRIYQNQQNGN